MARIVVLNQQGIEASLDRWFFQIQGDPSSLGLKAGVGSLAFQDDSAPKGQLWEKTTTADTGWVSIGSQSTAGNNSASGAYRISAYNVPVDGSDATTPFTTLVGTTIPQTGGPYSVILGPTDVLQFAADYTIPANVRIQSFGGVIKPASGKKVTLMAQPEGLGKMFDHSAGGTVVAGVPMTVKPEWWGAFPSGASSATVDPVATVAALKAIVPTGGTLLLSQMYDATTAVTLTGIDHTGITIDGQGVGGWKNTADKSDTGGWIVQIVGASAYSVKNLTIKNVTIRGNGATDYLKAIWVGNADGVTFENCKIYNVAKEGFYIPGATSTKNVRWINCYAENIGVNGNLSAYNAGAHNASIQGSRSYNCGMFTEQAGVNFRMIGNHSELCGFAHAALASTWSSSWDGTTEVDYDVALIANNLFLGSSTAITMSDIAGHVVSGHQTHGGTGKFLITGNTAIGTSGFFSGGCDLLNEVIIQGNYLEDAPNGNASAIDCSKGRFVIKGNTIKLGVTHAWASIIRCGDRDPANTTGVIEGNTIIGAAWAASAFTVGPEVTLAHNIFESPPTAASNTKRYLFAGNALEADGGASLSTWIPGTDTWLPVQDADFVYAPSQTSRIRVLNSTPAKGTWQVGDRAENVGTANTIPGWLCTTGGTADTISVGVTISTTSASKNFTVTAGTSRVCRYQWVTIAGVTGAKQLATYDPVAGTGTFDTTASATVTSGAVAYSAPVWTATNNAASLSIASQAAGDILYASSTSAFARLAKSTDGSYLSLASGVPAWIDAPVRFDRGNSGSSLTVTRTPERQEQKVTLTAATPAITIDDTAIPSGGYLVTDFFQDATGSRVPTWALTSAGSINWVGGSAPTLTTTASKADRIVWHNEGSRITAAIVWQNF